MNTICKAIEYVYDHGCTHEVINDACNIFASSYEEYMTIWHYVTDHFSDQIGE